MSYGIDPDLVHAVIKHESNYNPNVIGLVGEIGLMQIRPEYSKLTVKDLFNPCKNIKEGVSILKRALQNCKHQADNTWIICYNLGVTGAEKIRYPQLHSYYKKVIANYNLIKE